MALLLNSYHDLPSNRQIYFRSVNFNFKLIQSLVFYKRDEDMNVLYNVIIFVGMCLFCWITNYSNRSSVVAWSGIIMKITGCITRIMFRKKPSLL